jgi:hypothetical protein
MLCGLLVGRDQIARPLELLSNVLPVTDADDALRAVADQPGVHAGELRDLAITQRSSCRPCSSGP